MEEEKKMSKLLIQLKQAVRDDKKFQGMCITICSMDLHMFNDINRLRKYLDFHKIDPELHWRDTSYWWTEGVKAPRYRWLSEEIRRLKSLER